jgi:RepB DNA-primase from phage plasmid
MERAFEWRNSFAHCAIDFHSPPALSPRAQHAASQTNSFGHLLSTLVARQLASRFGGDRGSCDWRHFGRLAGFTNQKKERQLQNGLQPFVGLRGSEGNVYSAANEFLREVEALTREQLSLREPRKVTQPRWTGALVRPLASFHADSRYGGDLHRADMAWASQAAARGLSNDQIKHEILNGRDLLRNGVE